jgi:hypothetical protein
MNSEDLILMLEDAKLCLSKSLINSDDIKDAIGILTQIQTAESQISYIYQDKRAAFVFNSHKLD